MKNNVGIVVGKFDPLHIGHINMIQRMILRNLLKDFNCYKKKVVNMASQDIIN